MINNSTEIFTTNFTLNASSLIYEYPNYLLSLLYKYTPYLLSIITFLFGFKLKFVLADRQFLRNEIYSPLYQDIKQISKNISNYEYFDSIVLGQASSTIGKVRNSLIDTGKYNSIPKRLRNDIDSYYSRCEEYNKQLKSAHEEIYKIVTEEIKKIKTEEDHRKFLDNNKGNEWRYDEVRKKRICNNHSRSVNLKFLIKGELSNSLPHLNDKCNCLHMNITNNRWDNTITIDDLNRNSLSLEDIFEKFIELVGKNYNVNKIRILQNELKNSEKLLRGIQNRIQNPNLLFEILGI